MENRRESTRDHGSARGLVMLVFSALLLCAATRVFAQPAPDGDTLQEAVEEFNRGNFDEAYALFRHAHEVAPSARTLRAIGMVSFELRHYVESVESLRASLTDPRKPLTAAQSAETSKLLKRAQSFVATYRITLQPADATLSIDEHPVQLEDGVLLLDPGEHALLAAREGHGELRRVLRARAGTQESLKLDLDRAGERSDEQPAGATRQPAPSSRHIARPWTWSLAAAAVATGAVGLGLGIATKNKHDTLTTDCRDADGTCASATKGQRLQRAANGTLASAGVLLGGAVLAYFLEGREKASDRRSSLAHPRARLSQAMLLPTRNGLMIEGSF